MLANAPDIKTSLNSIHLSALPVAEVPQNAYIVCKPRNSKENFHLPEAAISPIKEDVCITLQNATAPTISISRLVKMIAKGMETCFHEHAHQQSPYATTISSKLLAFAVCTGNPFATLQTMKRFTNSIQVTTWTMSPLLPAQDNESCSAGEFTIGRWHPRLLDGLGSSKDSNSTHEPSNQLSISRESTTINTVDIQAVSDSLKEQGLIPEDGHLTADRAIVERIVDDYYTQLAQAERERFINDFEQQTAYLSICGGITPAVDNFHPRMGTAVWYSYFIRENNSAGWCVPALPEPPSPWSTSTLQNEKETVDSQLKITDWGRQPLDKTLQQFCEYYHASTLDSRPLDESILHQIFGLDLLLGGATGEQKLAKRVAMLTHIARNEDFDQAVNFIQETYDLRSSYVHQGKRSRLSLEHKGMSLQERLTRITEYCKLTFAAGLFVRKSGWCCEPDARNLWINQIDLLIAQRKAGQEIQSNQLDQLGLNKISLTHSAVPDITVLWPPGMDRSTNHTDAMV